MAIQEFRNRRTFIGSVLTAITTFSVSLFGVVPLRAVASPDASSDMDLGCSYCGSPTDGCGTWCDIKGGCWWEWGDGCGECSLTSSCDGGCAGNICSGSYY